MLDCRPEDIDSRASSRLAESDDLAASDRGLALHLAGIVAGVELVESDDPVMQMCRSFDEACESAEANQDICLPLSCALTAVNHFLKDEAAAKEHFKKLHLADATTETFLPSLATLSEFLVHHTPEKDDGSLLKKHFAPVIEGDYDGPTAGEHYAKLLSETLSRMDEESRALFTASFLTLGYLMSGIFARTPEEIEEFFKQAFPGFIVDPIIAMCMSSPPPPSSRSKPRKRWKPPPPDVSKAVVIANVIRRIRRPACVSRAIFIQDQNRRRGLLEISAGLCIPCSWPRLRPRPTPLSLSPKRQGKTRSESNAGRASSQGVVFGLSA